MRRDRMTRWTPVVAVAVAAAVWLPTGGTHAAFSTSVANASNSFASHPDWRPPVFSRATVIKAEGGIAGYVRAGGSYRIVAAVADDPSSNPASGVGTVTGNASALTAGATGVALPAGAVTVDGLTYTHQSAAATVAAGTTPGTKAVTATAADLSSPVNTSAAFAVSAIVDNAAPAASNLVITNGGIAGRVDVGDTLTFTWNDVVDPDSVIPGWTGAATDVSVEIEQRNGSGGDRLTIRNAANTADLPFGTVTLDSRDYVSATTVFGGPGAATRSRLSWSAAAGGQLVVSIGTPAATGNVVTSGTGGNYDWTPSATITDRAGNPSTTTGYTEPGAADREF